MKKLATFSVLVLFLGLTQFTVGQDCGCSTSLNDQGYTQSTQNYSDQGIGQSYVDPSYSQMPISNCESTCAPIGNDRGACDSGMENGCGGCGRTLSLFGGFNQLNFEDNLFPVESDFGDDWIAGISLGRRRGQQLRTELELSFRENVEENENIATPGIGGFGGGILGVDGEVKTFSGMYNVLLDLGNGCTRPYIGAGIGYAHVDGDLQVFLDDAIQILDVSEDAFAWQIIGGVSRQMNASSELYVEYRYFTFNDFETPVGDFENFTHSLVAGLRFGF